MLLLLASAALVFPQLGSAPLERAEIYFMDGARAMVESGDYLVPRYRGEPFFDKPPLTYWLIAAAYRLEGFSPRAARLVPAAAAVAAVLATVVLGGLVVGRRAALAGGLMLATTLAFLGFARLAMSDMLLTLFTTVSMAAAWAAWRHGAPVALWLALGASLGLGFLTKGPIALLLPGLGVLLLTWRRRGDGWPLTWGRLLAGAAVFVLVGLTWFAAVHARLGSGPLAYFFLRENLERFAGEAYDSGRAPWYYLGAYLAEGLPWSPFLALAGARALARRDAPPGAGGVRFLLGWLGLMAIPLSLSRGKLDYYLLPLYPAACLAIGWLFEEASWRRLERTWSRVVLLLLGLALLAVPFFPTRIPRPWLPGAGLRTGLLAAFVIAGGGLVIAAARVTARRTLGSLAAAMAVAFFGVVILVLPAFRSRQPNADVVRDVLRERRYRPDTRLALCEDPLRVQRDVLFHARLAAEERCALWEPATSRLPYLLLVRQPERASLETVPGMRIVGEYRYVPATALTLAGLVRLYDADELVLMANYPTDDPVAITRAKRERKRAMKERLEAPEEERDPLRP